MSTKNTRDILQELIDAFRETYIDIRWGAYEEGYVSGLKAAISRIDFLSAGGSCVEKKK